MYSFRNDKDYMSNIKYCVDLMLKQKTHDSEYVINCIETFMAKESVETKASYYKELYNKYKSKGLLERAEYYGRTKNIRKALHEATRQDEQPLVGTNYMIINTATGAKKRKIL